MIVKSKKIYLYQYGSEGIRSFQSVQPEFIFMKTSKRAVKFRIFLN